MSTCDLMACVRHVSCHLMACVNTSSHGISFMWWWCWDDTIAHFVIVSSVSGLVLLFSCLFSLQFAISGFTRLDRLSLWALSRTMNIILASIGSLIIGNNVLIIFTSKVLLQSMTACLHSSILYSWASVYQMNEFLILDDELMDSNAWL